MLIRFFNIINAKINPLKLKIKAFVEGNPENSYIECSQPLSNASGCKIPIKRGRSAPKPANSKSEFNNNKTNTIIACFLNEGGSNQRRRTRVIMIIFFFKKVLKVKAVVFFCKFKLNTDLG